MLTPNIELKNKTILVTGAAGFIGANLVLELLRTLIPGTLWELATVVMCMGIYGAVMLLIPAGKKQLAEIPILKNC